MEFYGIIIFIVKKKIARHISVTSDLLKLVFLLETSSNKVYHHFTSSITLMILQPYLKSVEEW